MKEKEIKEKILEGMIHVRTIIELVGKPKEHIEKTLKDYIKQIKDKYLVTSDVFEKAEEKDNFFTAFAELEILMKNTEEIIFFAFDYMPASIEILEPEDLILKNNELSGFMNDLLVRLHGLNTGLITARKNNKFYIKNTAVLLRNFIVVLLSSKPMTLKEIQPLMGVKETDIEKVITVLIKEGKVKKHENVYSVIVKK